MENEAATAPRWVTAEQIQDIAFGFTISDDELPAVTNLILKAENKLIARVPSLPRRVETGAVSKDTVRGVVEDIVLRVIRNPEGADREGVGGVSTSYSRLTGSGVIEILREDLKDLLPKTRNMGSISVKVPAWRLP